VAGFCECGNEHSDSIQCGEFFFIRRGTVSFSRRTMLHLVCGVSAVGVHLLPI